MELDKRKYKRKEVVEILDAYKTEYEAKLLEQKEKIAELLGENTNIKAELDKFKKQEKDIAFALVDAENSAKDIKEKAELTYSIEIERLKAFSTRWREYFAMLKEKYPMYPPVEKAILIKERIDAFLKKGKKSGGIDELEKVFDEDIKEGDKKFNPKEKIHDYIAATEGNGFNLDEVLNPGELQLEDLCKELGLME